MKVKITFKDPDALLDCIQESVDEIFIDDILEEELENIRELRKKKISEICGKWFEYGEYLKVEVDTEEQTCKVLEVD